MSKSNRELQAEVDKLREAIFSPVMDSGPVMGVPEYLRWVFMHMRANGMDPRSGIMRSLHVIANRLEDAAGVGQLTTGKEGDE